MVKIKRNSPCPCGSGIKYKKCCLNNKPQNETGSLGEGIIERPGGPTVYADPISDNARLILENAQVRLVDTPEQADLLWMRNEYTEAFDNLQPGQLINHFPNEGAMINKARLTEHLVAYDRREGAGATSRNFYPESYRLSHPAERDRFLEQLPDDDEPGNLWILKPGGLSRGKGIRILWQFDSLKAQLADPESAFPDQEIDLELNYIAQQYIRNPLLLNDRKSELRVYWLVASLDPLMVLVYRHGYARYTLLPFQLGDYENPLIHTTNTFQQKKHPDYDPVAEPKLTFGELESYLIAQGLSKEGFVDRELLPRIREALSYVVKSTVDSLKSDVLSGCFGVFGADLILDDTLHPWLIEVQKSPGLSHEDRVKKHIVPEMLKEAVQIVLEIQRRRRGNAGFHDLETTGYEWVIDER